RSVLTPRSEECSVEEARDAVLICTRTCIEATQVASLGDRAELFRGQGGTVVVGVKLLAAATATRVDEQERSRRDAWDEIHQRRWRTRGAQERDRLCLHCGFGEREPAARAADEVFADRAYPCALRDDAAEVWVGGRGLEHHLTAVREAVPPDPASGDVGPALQPANAGVDVPRPSPAEQVRVSLAAVVAARVQQEHPVAVADEHP